jgi:hypothetical protein
MSISAAVIRIAKAEPRQELKIVWVAVLIFILTAIIACTGIRASLEFGRLSVPPTYDDVVYFISAVKWLAAWPSRSIAESFYALLNEHAPVSTVMAIAGFLLTPGSYVGPYAVNATVVAGFLTGMAALVWRSRLIDIAICLIGVVCFPMLIQAMTEARPDLTWGLASGLALGVIVKTPIETRSLRAMAALGFFCGLAALIKPSALPASLACFGCIFLVSAAARWLYSDTPPTLKGTAWRFISFGLGITIALAPYLSVSFGEITGYIWRTLVEDREIWGLKAGLYDHAIYYAFGAGNLALGYGRQVGLVLFVGRLALEIYLKNKKSLIQTLELLSVIAIAYAVPTVSPAKSYYFGAMFYGIFIVSAALNFTAIVALARGAAGNGSYSLGFFVLLRVLVILVVAGTFLRAMTFKDVPLATAFNESTRQEVRTSTAAIWQTLRDLSVNPDEALQRPLNVSFSSPYPVNPSALQLYAEQARLQFSFRGEFFYFRLNDALTSLTSAEVIVVTSSFEHNLPVLRMGDEILQALDRRSDLCAIQTIPLSENRILRVYRKTDHGCSLPGTTH